MSSKSILFYAKAPMNVVMFRPLAEHLRKNSGIRLSFCGHSGGGLSIRRIYELGGLPGVTFTPRWIAKLKKYDMYLSPDKMLIARRARCKVQIYHGVSFKGRMYDPSILKFDKLFMVGEDMRRRYIERGILEENDPRIERIGMPKTDRLVDGSLNRDTLLREMKLDPSLPTVLYAPTWRPESSLYSIGARILGRLATDLRVNLLIKLHDLVMNPATNPVDWRKELPKYEHGDVHVFRDVDIIPAMFASDILISDASSVSNEFLLLDRPIVFIDVPELFRRYSDTIDLGGWGRTTGDVVAGYEELMEAVARLLKTPNEKSEIRRKAAADIFYNPGKATAKAVEAIHRILEE